MIHLIMIRHGPTDWNREGRLQGRIDRPLSAEGRALVARWQLPDDLLPDGSLSQAAWLVSPLSRARQTAGLLGRDGATVEPLLAEMSWGDWEGARLAELRTALGPAMVQREKQGLDFRPPGGESPRDVIGRLQPLLSRIAAAERDTVAVCHNGVIRALYAHASGWDMTGKPPVKLRDFCAHRFRLDADGRVEVDCMNIALMPAEAAT